MTHVCAVPDVCKTPSPGGPIPIPYINVAMDSNITDGAETVKIEGNPVANVSSKISTSTGDEPGSAGGLISSKFKGTVTWKMGSLDVKAEGKSVVRFLDTAFHNGNTFNTSFIDQGGTGVAYADDFDDPCPICKRDSGDHKIIETASSAKTCAKIVADLKEAFRNGSDAQKNLYAKQQMGKRKGWSGYMVGVMACKHQPPKLFAAMSGTYILDGFKTIAEANGCAVVGGGRRTPDDFVSANTSAVSNDIKKAAVEKAWKSAADRIANGDKRYSHMGICAGAHLLAKSGHAPVEMTEMFFAPTGEWGHDYDWKVEGLRQQARMFGTQVSEFSPWGNTVASCQTCQDLLFLTMCPERTCK
ncbi:DUF4150 domain-containing protein [Ideonella sp. A 288]|uniref:DUF4150 domain-containing protein n=1 Tax=Ideonella sp. A 288 TaxID=1962181 RepID=UPI0018FEDF9B|nr:DUF4150 domain-containing protein [Ideonella sp. A 288]